MKNISAMRFPADRRLFIVFLVLWLSVSWRLFPAKTLEISHRRANYFLVDVPPAFNELKPGTTGFLFLKKKNTPVGTFSVAEIHNRQCLCRIDSLLTGIDDTGINRVSFDSHQQKSQLLLQSANSVSENKIPQSSKRIPITISILQMQLTFYPLADHPDFYLSKVPVSMANVSPPDAAGIKKILFQIEKKTIDCYSADLIDFGQIHPLTLNRQIDFSNQNTLHLGTADGKLCMIDDNGGHIQYTLISTDTIKRFKKDMFFHIILKKRAGLSKELKGNK